jgi:hypothetical protein
LNAFCAPAFGSSNTRGRFPNSTNRRDGERCAAEGNRPIAWLGRRDPLRPYNLDRRNRDCRRSRRAACPVPDALGFRFAAYRRGDRRRRCSTRPHGLRLARALKTCSPKRSGAPSPGAREPRDPSLAKVSFPDSENRMLLPPRSACPQARERRLHLILWELLWT